MNRCVTKYINIISQYHYNQHYYQTLTFSLHTVCLVLISTMVVYSQASLWYDFLLHVLRSLI